MKPTFFKHKMREVKSFLQIVKGIVTRNNEERMKGVDNALESMKDEKKVYLDEKKTAQRNERKNGRDKSSRNDKVIRESGRDISAI